MELDPCPFCGSNDVVMYGTGVGWYARCCDCAAASDLRDSRDEAVAAWNRRTVDVDELIEIADELGVFWMTPSDKRTALERKADYSERIRKAVGL